MLDVALGDHLGKRNFYRDRQIIRADRQWWLLCKGENRASNGAKMNAIVRDYVQLRGLNPLSQVAFWNSNCVGSAMKCLIAS